MRRRNQRWAYALTVFMLLSIIIIPLNNGATAIGATANSTSPAVNVFSDVPADNPNLPFIVYLSGQGILKGYPDGKFFPENGLTRAEAATVIARAAGLTIKPVVKSPFRDVGNDYWAQTTIAAVTTAGYLKGYPDGRFLPEAKLTRAEGITLMLRLSKQPVDGVIIPTISDVTNKHWAASSIAVALSAGMIGLTADNKKFLPDQSMTRAEMARALGVLLTKDPDLSSRVLTGTVTVKKGQVSLLKAGTASSQIISGSVEVKEGDILYTNSDGEAEISFPDGSGFLVKPDSQMDIKTMKGRAYIKSGGAAGTGIGMLEIGLKQGTAFGALATETETSTTAAIGYERMANLNDNMLAASTNDANKWYVASQKPVRVQVDMPWGVCAVRGTFWQNFVRRDGSGGTSLLTGHAEVVGGGQTVALTAGQQTSSSGAGTPPAPPAVMSSEIKKEWTEATNWAKERATVIENNQEINSQAPTAKPAETVENKVEKALETTNNGGGGSSGGNHTNTIVPIGTNLGTYSLSEAVKLATTEYSQDGGVLTRKFNLSPINNPKLSYYRLYLKSDYDYYKSPSAASTATTATGGAGGAGYSSGIYYYPISSLVPVSQPVYVLEKLIKNPENVLVKFYEKVPEYDEKNQSKTSPLKQTSIYYYGYYDSDVTATARLDNLQLTNIDTKTISGKISLPEGITAPTGGLGLYAAVMGISTNGIIMKGQELTVPSGASSVAYNFSLPDNLSASAGYAVQSYLKSNCYLDIKYLTTADTLVSVIDGSKDNVDLTYKARAYTKTISGTIALPEGVIAPTGGLTLRLYAYDTNEDSISGAVLDQIYKKVTIPAGQSTVEYSIGVPDTFSSSIYCSIETDNNLKIVSDHLSVYVNVSGGSQTGINMNFTPAQLISGTLETPVAFSYDTEITLIAHRSSGACYYYYVTIPKGQTSVTFTDYLPKDTYKLEYQLEDSTGLANTNILGDGWYDSGSAAAVPEDTAETLNLSSQDVTGINFKLAIGNQIKGTISLPAGVTAPLGGLYASVYAHDAYGNEFRNYFTLPENSNSTDYSITVLPSEGSTTLYDLEVSLYLNDNYYYGYYYWTNETADVNASSSVNTINVVIKDYALLDKDDIEDNSIAYLNWATSLKNDRWSDTTVLQTFPEVDTRYFKYGGKWFDLSKTPALTDSYALAASLGINNYLAASADTLVARYQSNTLWDFNTELAVGNNGVIVDPSCYDVYHITDQQLNSIAWKGYGNCVAVGNDSTIFTASYPDYAEDFERANTDNLTGNLRDVCDSGYEYVALGDNNAITFSTDGSSWSTPDTIAVSPGVKLNSIMADAYNHPEQVNLIAVGTNGTVMLSYDRGASWTTGDTLGVTKDLNDIDYSNVLDMFIAVGDDGALLQAHANNAGVWSTTADTLGVTADFNKVFWTGSQFIVVGDGGVILTSTDGSNWTKVVSGTTRNLYGVGYEYGYVIVGEGGIIITPYNYGGLGSPALTSAADSADIASEKERKPINKNDRKTVSSCKTSNK